MCIHKRAHSSARRPCAHAPWGHADNSFFWAHLDKLDKMVPTLRCRVAVPSSTCLYTCLCTFLYTCLYTYLYTCLCTCLWTHVYTYGDEHVYKHVYTHVYTSVYKIVYEHVCTNIRTHVRTHVCTHLKMPSRRAELRRRLGLFWMLRSISPTAA